MSPLPPPETKRQTKDLDLDLIGDLMMRQSPFPASLQRQSSGSNYGESSISGDYFLPDAAAYTTHLPDNDDVLRFNSYSSKSWAQQAEESYQLQLALALRLSSEAMCADDPNLLVPVTDEIPGSRPSATTTTTSAEALSHRFWESGRIPSLELLKAIDTSSESSIQVILIDRRSDPSLWELQNRIDSISSNSITTLEVVDQLAKLVCNRMGGATLTGEDDLVSMWKDCSEDLKDCLGSIVLPIGSLSVGLCRHRALLFKILADTIDQPCRIANGCKYCKRDDASSCLVRFGIDKELLVDLIGNPGSLCEPDSLLNGPSTISISSPLGLPRFIRSLARQYFADCDSLNLVFEDPSNSKFNSSQKVGLRS